MAIKDPTKRAELTEHLDELRKRLIRSILYIIAGVIIAWYLYDYIFWILTRPMLPIIGHLRSKMLLTNFIEPFMVQMQVSIVSGIVITCPLVIMEAWGFVSPGLTQNEKRPIKWLAPLSALLFIAGVVVCYLILPAAFSWFACYIPKNAELRPDVQASIIFIAKMLLVFGLLFQVPIIMMILARIGLVNSKMLSSNWRIAVVLISIIAAVATPSNDALSMIIAAVPMTALYFLGIILIRIVEKYPRCKRRIKPGEKEDSD